MEDPLHQLLDTDAALVPLLEAAEETASSDVSVVRALVLKIIQEPDIFVGFDQVKAALEPALKQADGEKVSRTLDLFSFGSYADYTQNPSVYLPLSDAHVFKLRQLTVLSIVEQASLNKTARVTLAEFQQALQLADINAAEQVVISCLYQRVMAGQLCQKTASLILSCRNGPVCRARDVSLAQVSTLLQQVRALQERLAASHSELSENQNQVLAGQHAHRLFCQQAQERMKKAEHAGNNSLTGQVRQSGWAEASGAGGDAMDVSGGRASSRQRQKRSRGGWSGMGNFGGGGAGGGFQH
jgi:COP9 signalosome complex subunit 7